jgi:integrase
MSRRSTPGVYEDKKRGTWYYVVDIGLDPATGKRRQQHRGGFKSPTGAKKALQRVSAKAIDGGYVEPSAQPVRVYLENWLKGVESNHKPSTAATYEHKLTRYVIPRIGAMPLRAVDATTLDALYADLKLHGGRNDKNGNPQPISEQSVAVVHRILHKALSDAVKRRLIHSNPATDAVVPKSTAPKERDAWDSDELRTFFGHVADDRLYALWVVATTTGMRRGELCGLKWSDVNLDAAHLVVQRSRVPVRGRGVVESTPKSGEERGVTIAPETVAALRAHRKHQLEERLACGEGWTENEYIFRNEDGTPMRPDVITSTFKAIVAAAKLRPIVFYGLRHSHITLGLADGTPVKVMQERVGHKKIETTYGYAHVLPGMQERAAASFENLIFGP